MIDLIFKVVAGGGIFLLAGLILWAIYSLHPRCPACFTKSCGGWCEEGLRWARGEGASQEWLKRNT